MRKKLECERCTSHGRRRHKAGLPGKRGGSLPSREFTCISCGATIRVAGKAQKTALWRLKEVHNWVFNKGLLYCPDCKS